MAEPSKPDLSYVCPHCGQKAVLGSHFCQTTSVPTISKSRRKGVKAASNRWLFLVAVVFLGVAVAWRWLGPASLLAAALGLLLYLLFRGPKGQSGAAYRDLVRMCGTEEAANSLIQAEIKRAPKTSRQKAIRAALERYQRDLSR